jgi:hypothetical protein
MKVILKDGDSTVLAKTVEFGTAVLYQGTPCIVFSVSGGTEVGLVNLKSGHVSNVPLDQILILKPNAIVFLEGEPG